MTSFKGAAPSRNQAQRQVRVLLLGHNYAPEVTGIGPYNTQLAEHLAATGHDVTVLTTFPHYPKYRWDGRPGIFRSERINGVRVRRLRVILPRHPNTFWRVVFDSSVGLGFLVTALVVRRPDVIVATVPTLQGALAASLVARVRRARAILMVQDLPVEAGLAVGMLSAGLGLRIAQRIEGVVFRLAHHSVVISEQFQVSIISKGVDPGRISVISDWVDLGVVRPAAPDPDVRRRLSGSSNGFLWLHSGSMARKQGLQTLVSAASLLTTDDGVHLAIVGDGPDRTAIESRIAAEGLQNVRVHGIQPADEFPKILAAADALVLSQRGDVVDSVVPSKLLSYMASGRPIIASVNHESVAAKLVIEARCGLVVPPENAASVVAAVRQLRADPALRISMGRSGRLYAEQHFGRDVALSRWTSLVSGLAADPPSLC